MAIEIERKFLVQGDEWRALGVGTVYRQGYIAITQGKTVRVRIAGDQGFLTIKGGTVGIAKREYEYAIPLVEAAEMLDVLCDRPLIEKTRYKIPLDGVIWEVDEFAGENAGLIMAEVELTHIDQAIQIPAWVGPEVTGDPRYFNAYLSKHPFQSWGLAAE